MLVHELVKQVVIPTVVGLTAVISISSVAFSTVAEAQDRETVRKMVFGHEAFLQDCVERQFDYAVEKLAVEGETPSESFEQEARELMRETCDTIYEGRNICRDADHVALVEKVIDIQGMLREQLLDPLTAADEFTVLENVLQMYEWEELALRDPINHCT